MRDEKNESRLEAVYLIRAAPEYEMEVIPPQSEAAKSIETVCYDLVTRRDAGYAVFLNMLDKRNLISEDGETPKSIAVMKSAGLDSFELGLNLAAIKHLSMSALRELLKLQALRIPYGHFGQKTRDLLNRFGPEIAHRAGQIVISQLVDAAVLAEEGIILPVPEMWEFDRNLTQEQYCELLSDEGEGQMPAPIYLEIRNNNSSGDANIDSKLPPEAQEAMEQLRDENGLTRVDMPSDAQFEDIKSIEAASKRIIEAADSALKASGSDLKSQGFMRGDAEEFIKALNRPATIEWTSYLRGMTGRYESRKRISTWRRLNRNCIPIEGPSGEMIELKPGRKRLKKPLVLVVVDTSGSMRPRELRCVDAELQFMRSRATVHVLQVDADVAKEPVLYDGRQKFETWTGRGGTSFKPAFDYAHKMSPRPNFLVYFTDGYDFGGLEEESDIPTLWVLTSTGMDIKTFREKICDWGEICKIDVGDKEE